MELTTDSIKLIEALETELKRCSADVTFERLTELYALAMECDDWYFIDPRERSNLFFEIRSLVVFKRHMERLIESLK